MSEGRETVPGVREEAEVTPDETSTIESTPTDSPEIEAPTKEEAPDEKNESARDTVLKELKKLQEGDVNGDKEEGSQEEKVVRGKDGKFTKPAPVEPVIDDLDPDLQAPERLKAHEKQLFNNLPKGLKRAFSRSVKDLEGGFTKERQDFSRERDEVRSIRDAVMPYASKWGAAGHTVPAAIAALAAAQEKLTTPETKLQTYFELGRDIGVPENVLATLGEHLKGTGQQVTQAPPAISTDPEFKKLQQNYNELKSYVDMQRASPAVQEINAVQQEIDQASGKLRYPELKDDMYLQSLKSRVSELVGTEPGLSLGDALRRAADERREQLGFSGYSTTPIQTRLPAATAPNTRANTAAVSVRGRSAPSISPIHGAEPPPEALRSARATVEWALQQQRRGA